MASYAANFTKRLKLSYSSIGANYTQTWRLAEGFSEGALADQLAVFYGEIAPVLPASFNFTGAEVSNQGEDFFLPTDLSDLSSFEGSSVEPDSNLSEFRASALQFVGKTTTGNPWRVTVFTAIVAPFASTTATTSDNFRITTAESSLIAGAIATLEGAVSIGLCGNDGNPIIFRQYANVVISRYRINRIRRFG